MTGLLIMIVCCTVLAAFSNKRTHSISKHYSTGKDHICLFLLTSYMVIFAGLRVQYNDTWGYIRDYASRPTFPNVLKEIDWSLGENPGFRIFGAIIRTFTDNANVYLMTYAAITYGINMWFIRKYSKNFTLSVLLFFMLGYYSFAMAALKQTTATAILLVALDRLIRNKKIQFFCLVLLASTFHPYSLMYLMAPIFMNQIPWEKGTWFLLAAVAAIAYSFNFLPGILINITESMGESYGEEMFVGEGVNIFRVLVYLTPIAISFIWKKTLFRDSSKVDNLFINCSFVCAMIMFIGLFGNANTFARLSMYFEPPIYIALPWMLYRLKVNFSGFILTTGTYIAFPLYFLYQNVIAISFDQAFASISIWQFFNSLFV